MDKEFMLLSNDERLAECDLEELVGGKNRLDLHF